VLSNQKEVSSYSGSWNFLKIIIFHCETDLNIPLIHYTLHTRYAIELFQLIFFDGKSQCNNFSGLHVGLMYVCVTYISDTSKALVKMDD